ncbi:MAG: DUF3263 domain-containing protein [Actinomycetota bacterium]|jgi:hypothetical protein|nr:DUF3263 domain-containing protein [Actinomycetota bacterium]
MGLTEKEKSILDFEQRWRLLPGPKEQDIRNQLSMSATSYYALLGRLLDSAEALRYDPLVVRRLRRLRHRRRRVRFEGRSAEGRPSR